MADETLYELWQALGGDRIARQTINGISRHYHPTKVTRALLREKRYDLPGIRTIGPACLERIDKLLKDT